MAPQGRTRPVASRLSPRASHLTSSGPQTHRHSCLLPTSTARPPLSPAGPVPVAPTSPPGSPHPPTPPPLLEDTGCPPPELPEGVPPHPTPGSIPPSTCTRPAPCQSHPWFLCSEDRPPRGCEPTGQADPGSGADLAGPRRRQLRVLLVQRELGASAPRPRRPGMWLLTKCRRHPLEGRDVPLWPPAPLSTGPHGLQTPTQPGPEARWPPSLRTNPNTARAPAPAALRPGPATPAAPLDSVSHPWQPLKDPWRRPTS